MKSSKKKTIFTATNPAALAPCLIHDRTYPNFTVDVVKSSENNTQKPISYFIQSRVEMCYGAHYYAHSAMSTAYPTAQITIDLTRTEFVPSDKNNRVACISLSCSGYNGGACDMGIENKGDGEGWFAHYWSYNNNAEGSKDPHNDVKSVTITVEAITSSTGNDALEGEYIWTKLDGTKITEYLRLTVPKGKLFTRINDLPYVRWTRFMSVIHTSGDLIPSNDPDDGSRLKGVITNPQLINLYSVGTPWGENLLDYIWGTQAKNISTFIVNEHGDIFECEHTVDVY